MCFVISGWCGLVLHITAGRDRTEQKKYKEEINKGLYPLFGMEYT